MRSSKEFALEAIMRWSPRSNYTMDDIFIYADESLERTKILSLLPLLKI